MKKKILFLFLVLLISIFFLPNAYALPTPDRIVNHNDISSVESYIDDVNVRNALNTQKWLFTHASVGGNMVTGMRTLNSGDSRYLLGMINVTSVSTSVTTSNGNVYEINRGNPGIQAKLDIFASAFNTYGWASKVNIAMNKYCYIDLRDLSSTVKVADMPTYANQYINSMQTLETSYPEVTFVYATSPTTTASGLGIARIYAFNQLVRSYASANGKYLLDIADIESHDPSGVHHTGEYMGDPLELLYSGYTTDGGHLNTAVGQQMIALGWYAMAISIAYNNNEVVDPAVPVTGITVNPTTATLFVGGSTSITPTVSPSNATNKSVTWTSSNTGVATVSNEVVTAIKGGTVTITVRTVDGNKTATLGLTIKSKNEETTVESKNIETLTIKNKDVTQLEVGQTLKLEIIIEPLDATSKEVVWTSSDNSIAIVDSNGIVKAIKKGTAIITVTSEDGSKTDKISLNITQVTPQVPIPLTDIKIKAIESSSLDIGAELQLQSILEPSNATDVDYIWESSDNSIATVSQEGVVKAIKNGIVMITLKTKDGKFSNNIELNITEKKLSKKSPNPNIIIIGPIAGILIMTPVVNMIIKRNKR